MRTSKITTALAVTALIVAVLGTTPLGHAAGSILPRNSVGAPQVKKAAITSGKLRNGAVTGTKVLDGSLTAADFKAGSLPAGPKGDKGDQGVKGDKGDTGPSDVYTTLVTSHQIGSAWTEVATVSLPPEDYLVSAKLYVTTNGLSIPSTVVDCSLAVGAGGAAFDYAQGTISSNAGGPVEVASMALANPYPGADYASLYCKSPVAALARWVRITATKVGTLHY
jgi:hypothetical protein